MSNKCATLEAGKAQEPKTFPERPRLPVRQTFGFSAFLLAGTVLTSVPCKKGDRGAAAVME
jgi:hypothetical protein